MLQLTAVVVIALIGLAPITLSGWLVFGGHYSGDSYALFVAGVCLAFGAAVLWALGRGLLVIHYRTKGYDYTKSSKGGMVLVPIRK